LIICWVYFDNRDLLAACSLYLLKSLPTSPPASAEGWTHDATRQFFAGFATANSPDFTSDVLP